MIVDPSQLSSLVLSLASSLAQGEKIYSLG